GRRRERLRSPTGRAPRPEARWAAQYPVTQGHPTAGPMAAARAARGRLADPAARAAANVHTILMAAGKLRPVGGTREDASCPAGGWIEDVCSVRSAALRLEQSEDRTMPGRGAFLTFALHVGRVAGLGVGAQQLGPRYLIGASRSA